MSKEKEKIDNPFVTTGYVSAEYFCDREKETQDIIRYLTNGNNVALISPRRYGKSDLLRHNSQGARPEVNPESWTD